MHPYISGCAQDAGCSARWGSLWISGFTMSQQRANHHCAPATDVGMHGLLASQSCYHSVLPPCLSTLLASSRFLSLLNRHPYILLISLEIFFITCLYPGRRKTHDRGVVLGKLFDSMNVINLWYFKLMILKTYRHDYLVIVEGKLTTSIWIS